MGNEKINKLLIGFIFIVICFALDRLSKIYILNILNNEGQVDLYINQFLNIYLEGWQDLIFHKNIQMYQNQIQFFLQ